MRNEVKNIIKPCPFCGGYATLSRHSKTVVMGRPEKCCYVRCTKCDARGSRFIYSEFDSHSTAHKMSIINWNKRYKFKDMENN